MKNLEYDKLNMYLTVKSGLIKHTNLWQSIGYLSDTINQFYTKIEDLERASTAQSSDLRGYTDQKISHRQALESQLLFVAMQIKGYASIEQNESLYNQMRYTKSSLTHSREKDLVYDAVTLHAIATEHLAGISNFGVTANVLNQLQNSITLFTDAVNQPILEQQTKKEATGHIKIAIKELDDLIKNRLDTQMLIFKTINPTFHLNYRLNRKIKGSPTTKLAMRIKVVDAHTQTPLPKAYIVIKDHNIKRRSSPLGQIVIHHLKEGEHIVTVTLAGYQQQAPKVTHVKGETTMVVVEMEREE